MTTTATENIPCPHCGSTDLREFETWLGPEDDYQPACIVECCQCLSQARKEWWNKRSPMAEVAEIMEDLNK